MEKTTILFAKIAALKKSFETISFGSMERALGSDVNPLLPRYIQLVTDIKNELPELYSDVPTPQLPKKMSPTDDKDLYQKSSIQPLLKNLEYILEVRTHSRIGERKNEEEKGNSIFISHGRSTEWFKVQSYIEKDIGYKTIELAQQPNIGRTVLQKLEQESNKCRCSIIVMTGDDMMEGGELRARENVMHEIGYFQGKLGLENVVLLHEEGVNVPSNIHGLVYIPFPKDTAEATLGALTRELKVLMA